MKHSVSPVSVGDLPDLLGHKGLTPFLWCPLCGEESSAHKGDYFLSHPDTVFECCGLPMMLVVKDTRYREWKVAP